MCDIIDNLCVLCSNEKIIIHVYAHDDKKTINENWPIMLRAKLMPLRSISA